jgi:hypothetical protein
MALPAGGGTSTMTPRTVDSAGSRVLVYRSADAGRTWGSTPSAWTPFMDREYFAFDRSGKHPGRLYMHGTYFMQGIDTSYGDGTSSAAVRLYYSSDGGTWTTIGSQTINITGTFYVGLASCSIINTTNLCTSTVESFYVK